MELKVGMYVRTPKGIAKIKEMYGEHEQYLVYTDKKDITFEYYLCNDGKWTADFVIGEPSFDITDVIYPGDLINGSILLSIDYAYDADHNCDKLHYYYEFDNVDKDINEYYDKLIIENIVTKEQIKDMKYIVED